MENVSLQAMTQQLKEKKAQAEASVAKLQLEVKFNVSGFANYLHQRVDILVASGGSTLNPGSPFEQELLKAISVYQSPLVNEINQAFNLLGIFPFADVIPLNIPQPISLAINMEDSLQVIGEKLLQKKAQVEASLGGLAMEVRVNLIGFYEYLTQRFDILAVSGGSIPNPVVYLQEEIAKASSLYLMPLGIALAEAFNLQAVFLRENGEHGQQQASGQACASFAAANQPENEANSGIVARVEVAIVEEESDHLEEQDVVMSSEEGSVAGGEGNDSNENAIIDETADDADSDAANSGPIASTSGRQDINNHEEILGDVLENAQQQAEQRIVNVVNPPLSQPPPVLHSPVVSILTNQTAQVNPPGESAISQADVNSGQNDGVSVDVSIKSEVDSSSESECESDTDDEAMQVKEEPNEEEDITGRSEEQTDNASNSNDNRETNDSQNDHSNEAANEQEFNDQAMMIDSEEANLEEDPNGPINIEVQYASPPSSPSNAEESINHSSAFISHSNPDNQINVNGNEIASHYEIGHVDADDDGDDFNEDAVMDETNDDGDSDENMSDIEDEDQNDNDVDASIVDDDASDGTIIDETNYEEDGQEEEEAQAAPDVAGPSSMTLRRSTRNSARVTQVSSAQEQQDSRVSKRNTVSGRSSNGPRNGRNEETEPLRVIMKKLKCTVPGCKKVVKSKSALDGHFLTAHKLKRYRCLVRRCYGKVSTSFATQAQFSDHLDQKHGRTSRLACQCSMEFKSYKDLYLHNWKYHQLGLFVCSKDGCTAKPRSTRIQVQHHQFHHLQAKFVCPVDGCDRSFKQKGNLDNHRVTHSGDRPFPCTDCDKSFSRKDHLVRHLRIHRNEKTYRCTWHQCTHSASDRSAVIAHIRCVHFKLPATKKQQAEENIIDDRDARDFLAKD